MAAATEELHLVPYFYNTTVCQIQNPLKSMSFRTPIRNPGYVCVDTIIEKGWILNQACPVESFALLLGFRMTWGAILTQPQPDNIAHSILSPYGQVRMKSQIRSGTARNHASDQWYLYIYNLTTASQNIGSHDAIDAMDFAL